MSTSTVTEMSIRDQEEPFVTIHSHRNYLTMGTKDGIKIFNIKTANKVIKLIGVYPQFKNAYIIDPYMFSDIFFIVCQNSPNELHMYESDKDRIRRTLNFESSKKPILAVKSCLGRLVVCFEDSIIVHDLDKLQLSGYSITCSPPNPHGICTIVDQYEFRYFAYPSKSDLIIFSLDKMRELLRIREAGGAPLVAMAFSPDGKKIAAVDECGIEIRVFSTVDGTVLQEFRRGSANATIVSLGFCAEYICCSSDRETIHIFKIDETSTSTAAETNWYNGVTNMMFENQYVGLFRKHVTQAIEVASNALAVVTKERFFAKIPCPDSNVRRVVGFVKDTKGANGETLLIVACKYYILSSYEIPKEGGECKNVGDHDLVKIEVTDNGPDGFVEIAVPSPTNYGSLLRKLNLFNLF